MKERRLAKNPGRQLLGPVKNQRNPVRLEQAAGMRQRLEDRAGIRQPDVEAEVPGCWTTRMLLAMQNPNRAKTDMCDQWVYDYTKNKKGCTCVASVCIWH